MKDLLRLALLPLALTACLDEPDETTTTDQLFVPTGTTLFQRNVPIRVCWVTVTLPNETRLASTLQPAKDQFREELKNSWERWANVSFVGFDECPTSGSDQYVRIQIRWQQGTNDSGGACGQLGAANYQSPSAYSTTSDNSNLSCGVGPVRTYSDTTLPAATRDAIRKRWQYIAVHEMGHVLGFGHEQDRNSTCGGTTIPGTNWTAVDQDSVMNYCGSHGNGFGVLTPDDIRGVITAYGRRTYGPSMFFNGFEGTDADAWWFAGNANVDRNIGYGRTGQNNGWAANWKDWNADNVNVRTGGVHHRCDVEVQTKLNGASAQHSFWILNNPAPGSGWFDWTATAPNVYKPVKFSFDAAADTEILVAGFWGNGSANHYQQIDDVTVNCYANISNITRDRLWSTGASFRITGDHLAPGAAFVRYDNVPTSSGALVTRSGYYIYPDANGNLNAVDDGLNTAGLTCTPAQLASKIYATIVDGSGTTSQTFAFPARLLCYNG